MTKAELIKLLGPYPDDAQIITTNHWSGYYDAFFVENHNPLVDHTTGENFVLLDSGKMRESVFEINLIGVKRIK